MVLHTHRLRVSARRDVQPCARRRCARCVRSFAHVHQMHAIPLFDSQLLGELVCSIANHSIEVTGDVSSY